jgi:hypothetical protein
MDPEPDDREPPWPPIFVDPPEAPYVEGEGWLVVEVRGEPIIRRRVRISRSDDAPPITWRQDPPPDDAPPAR